MFIKILNLLTLKQWLTRLFAIFCFTTASTSYAAQANDGITSNASVPVVKDAFEWQFMVDLSLASTQVRLADVEQTEPWDYFQLGLLLDISYKGFFLQSNSRRSLTAIGSGELGYQITVQENWQLDIILKAYIEGFDPAEIINNQKQNIPQLAGLNEREYTGGIALRYSHFFDNAIFYIDFANARTGKNDQKDYAYGLIIDSFYSHLLPYRNWDIYLGAGLTYYEQALVDYYIGIDADEVTINRPLHDADSGFRAQLEVYAQYPLSQSWSFNAGLTQTFYSNNIKQSPLVDKNKLTQLMIGVLYVF
ncbi:MAG: MipA/OmpV family protein [Colwellia sp.]|nr:MipA/OmpV family protein [Colwellia sp.]